MVRFAKGSRTSCAARPRQKGAKTMIELKPFQEIDFDLLNSHIQDAKFMRQWAGPKYTFPLTWEQIDTRNRKTINGVKAIHIFKAIHSDSNKTIGFVEIIVQDLATRKARIGSVLVFEKYRGFKYGKELMKESISLAFNQLNMLELTLGVYDFNLSAIMCYKSLGFEEIEFIEDKNQFENQFWNSIEMKLNKTKWE